MNSRKKTNFNAHDGYRAEFERTSYTAHEDGVYNANAPRRPRPGGTNAVQIRFARNP